jgi:hypothetical protein
MLGTDRELELARQQLREPYQRTEAAQPSEPFVTERQAITRAAAHAQQQLDQLNPDIFTPGEITRQREAILAQYDAVADAQRQAVDEAEQRARDELTASELDDPLQRLSPEQLTKAESRRWIIEEDAGLPWLEVATRLRAALVQGDVATLTLWHRYLGRRLARNQEEGRGRMDLDGMRRGGGTSDPIPGELQEAWRQLEQKMANPRREERRQRAQGTIEDVSMFRVNVLTETRMKLTGEQAAMRKQFAQYIAGAF